MIKAIIFDMGGVVLLIKAEDMFKKLSENLEIEYEKLWKLFNDNKKFLLSGKMSAREFSEIVNKSFGINKNVFKIWDKTLSEVVKVNEKTVGVINLLKPRYKLALITDTIDIYESLVRKMGLYSLFDTLIISCEVGLVKSQKEIFKLASEKIGIAPEECVYIDDRAELIEIPKSMRFHTILFKNAEQLKKDLKSLGVKF